MALFDTILFMPTLSLTSDGRLYVLGITSTTDVSFLLQIVQQVHPSANSGPPPSPRDRHVSVAFANSFYVHGGFDGQSRDSRVFSFDFSSMAWREVVASHGHPPTARHSHSAVVHANSMYVFAGYDGSYKNDLHEFDFTVSRWSAVAVAGRRPRPRYRAPTVVYRNWMILYGGHDGSRHLSDTYLFDFPTRTWHSVVTEGPSPMPRDSHVAVVHGDNMYIFGGSSGSATNDLHELQLPSTITEVGKWRPVNVSSRDQPRPRFCHVAATYNDAMYVFGGYDGQERLDSFIMFDFGVYDLTFEIPPSTILTELRNMVGSDTLSDVNFLVENQLVYAHKFMLVRCSYFKALFLGSMRESQMESIHLNGVRYDIFLKVLEYLYTDRVDIALDDAMELFQAADMFGIPRLKTMCEKTMLQSITVDNAAEIFHAADMHSASALRLKVKKYILSHFDDVTKSAAFELMGRNNIELVFELLKTR